MSYSDDERARASAWKASSPSLPEGARAAAGYVGKDGSEGTAPYDFCFPPAWAELSLLTDVREPALALFAELGIPWHAGVGDGPSNHLLSSQVQCVNALMPMVQSPARLVAAFGQVLPIGEVLEIEPGRCLTFEYIGPDDVFGEAPGGQRTRGSMCTSVDAAFLHRAPDGLVELVLVEWKYTEAYGKHAPSPKDATRERRYGAALRAPDGPVRADLLPFEALLDEPLYQLMRQQLLAHELERRGAEGAQRVRVVHVTPAGNTAYQASLSRPEHKALGSTVSEVWQSLLRTPDRFVSMDSACFLDIEATCREYLARYGGVVVHDEEALLAVTGAEEAGDLADQLFEYVDGVVGLFGEEGLSVVAAFETVGFTYPFALSELFLTALRLEADATE